jgi:hypothetical protein
MQASWIFIFTICDTPRRRCCSRKASTFENQKIITTEDPVEYEIEAKDSDEFLAVLEEFSRVRRRDGASRWGVYYDTEHPTRYLETFIVESWAEHLRQHARLTHADSDVEERLHRFEAKPTIVRHFIYARSKGRR